MIESVIEAILAALKLFPLFDKWFSKSPLEKENDAKAKVEKEHEENKTTKRPSDDFWKDRGGL